MSQADGFLLVFGILIPLVMLHVVFAATLVAAVILILLMLYYKAYKVQMIRNLPEKQLLEEIRRR